MITYFKLFLRNLKRNKLFSIVNILGLTIGFFASTLIYLYVDGELSYDTFHEKGDQIYRINQTFIWGEDTKNQFSSTGPGVAYAINAEIPEVKEVLRIHTPDVNPISFDWEGEYKFFKDELVFAVDTNFFELFSFPLKFGDPKTALSAPKSVVLKPETSVRFFGEANPMGQLIEMDNGETYQITGVLEDGIPNSYLDEFDLLISLNSFDRIKRSDDNWMWTMFETFVLVEENTDVAALESKIQELPRKYAIETLSWMGYTYDEYIAAGKEWDLFLQPLTNIYLSSEDVINRLSPTGNFKIVVALTGAAFFLIVLSCINFINLSTARFTSRAKDVAVRKVLGISKWGIGRRFFSESILYCLVSVVIAFALIQSFIAPINQTLGTQIAFSPLQSLELMVFVLVLIAVISLITGFYPFIFFNAFKPSNALKGEMRTGRKGIAARNGMLITQYILSFVLIISSLTIYKQLNYVLSKDLGFEKENLLVIENVHWTGSPENFLNEIEGIDGVELASFCDGVPMLINQGDQFSPDRPEGGSIPLNFTVADEDYVPALGLDLMVGRGFDKRFQTDSSGIIINESAARAIGWAIDESIINRKITNWSGEYHVIGVVKNFNYWTLYNPIEPFAIFSEESNVLGGRPITRAAVKITSNDFLGVIDEISAKWSTFALNRPFESLELNTHFENSFQSINRFGGVLAFFSFLTIIIASLGLFGIVVFSIEQKLKEIGVRKVLGASLQSIVILFSRSYVKLLLIAFAISAPFGYYFMENWLSDFEYRIPFSPFTFAFSFVILLVISLAISIFHTTKASLMNPAEVLKDE